MLHRIPTDRLLLFCICGLLAARCGSPATTIENQPKTTIEVAPTEVRTLAAAYAERLRLGLGSPYRLIETVLHDERLGGARGAVAHDLITRIERGALYEIGPHALMAAGVPTAGAIAQLELIRQAVESARDPRIGELAVTLAYELAAAEQSVAPELVARVARIAALLRDRDLARADAHRLREAARRSGIAPELLVSAWRADRQFAVEQPTLSTLDAHSQEEAARLALLLVGGIRSAVAPVASVLQRTIVASHDRLAVEHAARIMSDTIARPVQAAVVITLRALQKGAKDARARVNAEPWQRFLATVTNEEHAVAALAFTRQDEHDDVVAAGIALDLASALRPYAQESIRKDSVSAQDLATRFGVRIRFDERVSARERTHALQVLAAALGDVRGVIRTIDFSGLTFAIGPIDAAAGHLAFHEPKRRVIHLDPATMAGTLAHELGHDLDWQLATRKYRTRSSYATDYATRNRRALAYTVESLIASAAPMNHPASADGARRPAEIFARRFEWYVVSALAARGRSNAYLSSAQTDWIAGYGSAVRPDPAPAAAKSFADLLSEAAGMDRTDRAAVAQLVTESAPVVVRILMRAGGAASPADFQRQALAELRDWTCGNVWHARVAQGAAIRWYVDALAAAAFPQTVATVPALPTIATAPFGRVRVVDPLPRSGSELSSCTPFAGAVLAQTAR